MSSRGGERGGRISVLNNQFYTSPPLAAVGRLYPTRCTATMVTRTIAVTAAHCLYNLQAPVGYVRDVSIWPGATFRGGRSTGPYGEWTASNWWVPDGYKAGDEGLDYGLVSFRQTTADGRYLGDVVGMWSITYNLQFRSQERVQGIGYPAEGFWAQPANGLGWAQFACDSTWDGYWERDAFASISSSNTAFVYADCTMNGGSSGGPWFRQRPDGIWTIGAIEARGRCYPDKQNSQGRCVPYARFAVAPYLDYRFGQFWDSIVG
jgi:V8-like Glu-specific endopeptidase